MFVHVKYHLSYVRAMVYLFLSLLLIFGVIGSTSVSFKQFTSQPDYFQATCQEGDNVLSEKTRSKTECLALCAQNANCFTALYNHPQCRGCANFYGSTNLISEVSEGTIHYQWTSVCGNGWQLWNKTCYRVSEPGTFQQGQAYCEAEEATAVAVETERENEFLKQMVRSLESGPESGYTVYFLGITDDCNGTGEWRQTADGKVVSFKDFSVDEPNGPSSECCVALFKDFEYKWVDISCTSQLSTICEKHLL